MAATLRNEAANGQTRILSEGRIGLGTAKLEARGRQGESGGRNHRHIAQTWEAGTTLGAAGDILIAAQEDLTVRQGLIEGGGKVVLSGRNIDIGEGRTTLDLSESLYSQSRGLASKKTSLDQYRRRHDEAAGSSIEGKEVTVFAGQDVNVRGSSIVSDGRTVLKAGNNVNLTAAQSTYHDTELHQNKKSGLMGSGGIGFSIGSKTDTAGSGSRTLVNQASTVGSLKGDTVIWAGQNYRQTGSTVSSPEGGVFIRARNIDIEAAQDTYAADYRRTLEQKGLTAAVNIPVVQAAQSAAAAAETIGKSKSGRVNAMAAANAAWQARQLLAEESSPANLKGLADTASALSGGDWKSAADTSNVSISLTYGRQKNTNQSHSGGTTAQASRIIGGGQVSLTADEGRLNITGSDAAGEGGTLLRAKDIVLQSAEQHHSERSSNRSSGWNAGVAVSYGQNGFALGFTGGGNYGRGYGNGDELTHRHSRIGSAGSRTVIQSSGDTTLKGAQVKGRGVALSAQNLNIESLQDSAVYRSKQQNLSGSVTVGYGFSGSAGYNQSKINAEHRSVGRQSGIFAGDEGFQVKVDNHTGLKGGIITSTAKAEAEGRNRFQTATLSRSDLENFSRYEGESFGLGVSGSISGQSAPAGKNGLSGTMGYGSDGGSRSSVTRSGIGTRNIVIGNDTDGTQAAAAYTATRSETAEQNTGRLNNAFDKEKVRNEIDLQREVTQEFGKNAAQGVAQLSDYLGNTQDFQRAEMFKSAIESELAATQDGQRRENLQQALNQVDGYLETNRGRYETWKEGGVGRSILHGAVGGLTTGNLDGVLGAGGVSAAAPYFEKAAENLNPTGKAVVDALGGAAVGYMLGGNAGAVTGANADWNNRQLHDSEIAKIKRLSESFAKQENISKAEAEKRLMVQAMRQVDKAYADIYAGYDQKAEAHLRANTGTFKADGKTFTEFANMGYYHDPNKFGYQTGYRAERARLYQNPAYTRAQRDSELNDKALKTISKGTAKGIANTPSVALNAPIDWVNEFTHGRMGRIPNVPYAYDYNNEVEAAVGNQTSVGILQLGSLATGVKAAAGRQTLSVEKAGNAKPSTVDGEVKNRNSLSASNVNSQAALKSKLSGLQGAQKSAVRIINLPDGRIRYYDKETPAKKAGYTRGASFVTEYNPKNGNVRQWMESYDQNGNVIRVHPKSINGQTVSGQHYPPTGYEINQGVKK